MMRVGVEAEAGGEIAVRGRVGVGGNPDVRMLILCRMSGSMHTGPLNAPHMDVPLFFWTMER